MKKLFLVIILAVLLTACATEEPSSPVNDNEAEIETVTPEPTQKPTLLPEPTNIPSPTPESSPTPEPSPALEDGEFRDGIIYDAAKSIHEDIKMINREGSLSVNIYLEESEPIGESEQFFSIAKEIIETCGIHTEYNSAVFSMYVSDEFISMISFLSITSPSEYSADKPMVISDGHKQFMADGYEKHFMEHDIGYKFEQSLNDLEDKYLNKKTLGITLDSYIEELNAQFSWTGENIQATDFIPGENENNFISTIEGICIISVSASSASSEITEFSFIGIHSGDLDLASIVFRCLYFVSLPFHDLDLWTDACEMISDMYDECGASGTCSNVFDGINYTLTSDIDTGIMLSLALNNE